MNRPRDKAVWERVVLGLVLAWAASSTGGEPARRAEDRFPPLVVLPGFHATLFAADPMIEYPSVIALGPRHGTIFVAIDYVKGLGREIERPDEIRLLADLDGDGRADQAEVVASGFGSIQGLEYVAGTLFVMHAPYLSALRDLDGDDRVDERVDLLSGLGLPPEQNPSRLHCANGVVRGYDGWLYLALGDNGCDVPRPEGDRLVLQGGGILRCRPDGRDLHVFATGLRNVYDLALDEEVNVFLRDNENDGGSYMVRIARSFFGADHGYPYLYEEHAEEGLRPLADLGRGSSAGAACYLEEQFPPEWRGQVFFCEWGRAVVHCAPACRPASKRPGGGGAQQPLVEHDFAWSPPEDTYGFRPTDIVVERDGSMIVSDWADGQSTRRGRGRIYRIRYGQPGEAAGAAPRAAIPQGKESESRADWNLWFARLDAAGHHERMAAHEGIERGGQAALEALEAALSAGRLGPRARRHAVWLLARMRGEPAIERLLAIAQSDPDSGVRRQALRAIADLADPVLRLHRLDAGAGNSELAQQLAALAPADSASLLLEVVVALGRLRWHDIPQWLDRTLPGPMLHEDPALAHAAMQAMRSSGNWTELLAMLDRPTTEPIRSLALFALAQRYEPEVALGLASRLERETDPVRQEQYARILARVCKKPGPWVYWGYRPSPRPPHPVPWELTGRIEKVLAALLTRCEPAVRSRVLAVLARERIAVPLETIRLLLAHHADAQLVGHCLAALEELPIAEVRGDLAAVVRSKDFSDANRVRGVRALAKGLAADDSLLFQLAGQIEEGPVLAAILEHAVPSPPAHAGPAPVPLAQGGPAPVAWEPLLVRKTGSAKPEVREVSVRSLARVGGPDVIGAIQARLADPEPSVRAAAIQAMGIRRVRDSAEAIGDLAGDADSRVRRAALAALRSLGDGRALSSAQAALADRDPELALAALEYLEDFGNADQAEAMIAVARVNPSYRVLGSVVRSLARWSDVPQVPASRRERLEQLLAEVQGQTGSVLAWHRTTSLASDDADRIWGTLADSAPPASSRGPHWQRVFGSPETGRVELDARGLVTNGAGLLQCEVHLQDAANVQFQVSSPCALQILLDGRVVYRQPAATSIGAESFAARLGPGPHWLAARLELGPGRPAWLQLGFRRASSTQEHERLVLSALKNLGDAENGRRLFFDATKTLCIGCHWLAERGERIGPDLTGIGKRFSRAHIVESILDPNRAIAPSYQTVALALSDGRLLVGVKMQEDERTMVIGDEKGQKHVIARSDLEAERSLPTSTMPAGLEKRLTPNEFVDLVSFLASQR